MSRLRVALAAALLLVACPGEPPPPPPKRAPPVAPWPTTPMPEPRADGRLPALAIPTRYALKLDVDPTAKGFTGSARIDVDVPEATSYVVLHGRSLDVREAQAHGAFGTIPARASSRVGQGGRAKEELVLAFARPLPKGKATLVVDYTATFDDELSGLYRVQDGERWYAFTQFEATDARRAFPCFDEPSFKVPFEIAVTTPKGLTAFANAPEASREDAGEVTRFRFAPTPPLPTYLVAIAVGDFDVVEATRYTRPPIRLITTKNKSALGQLALEATGGIVDELARWFDIPYPYDKLDIVAVPDFRPGAMENPGLVTFREDRLLLDPSRASAAARRSQALVIAHELAHQWFGDYVTASWWNDLWLNEGMASWMEWKIVERWRPSLGASADAVAWAHAVMDIDGLASARAVRQPVVSTSDAQEAFDGITYGKGAAVLSTIESWIGEEAFQRGIRAYLKENAWKSVQADRLFYALDRASGKDVTQMASGYLDRPGVPEVTAHLECDRGGRWHVELSQEPWRPLGSSKPEQSDQVWTIPVCVRAQGDKKSECAELAMGAPSMVGGQGRCPLYVHPNYEASYYRFTLDEKDLVRLAETRDKLGPGARLSIASNAWASVRSGKLKPEVLLKVLPSFDDDRTRQVTDEIIAILGGMSEMLVDDESRPAFRKFALARLAKRKKELGWARKDESSSDEAIVRPAVLAALGDIAEDDVTLREAEEHAQRWLSDPASVDADTASAAVDLASRRAGDDRLAALRAAAKSAKTREDRNTALRALVGFDDPGALGRALDVTLTDEVRAHEMRSVLGAALARRRARPITEAWVRAHWDELRRKLPGALGVWLSRAAAAGCTKAAAEDNAAFYAPRLADVEGAPRRVAEALELVSLCAELRARGSDGLRRALLRGVK